MSPLTLRLARVPLTIFAIWAVLAFGVPVLMRGYAPYVMRPGFACSRSPFSTPTGEQGAGACASVADLYGTPFAQLFLDATFRTLALLIGAALLALVLGTLVGVAIALLRNRAWASGAMVAGMTLLASVPAFFVAYFLQIAVIVVGASATTRDRLLPVYGFGYDEHLVLPLLSLSVAAVAFTAQLNATRMVAVLDTDFVLAARAKGLSSGAILRVHVLPHVRPVLLEGPGSGLRIAVASLPIIEYLFLWRGLGQLALEAVGVHDAQGFVLSALILSSLFVTLSAIADVARPRALYAHS